MTKLWNITRAAIAGAIALMVTTAFSAAQERPLTPTQTPHVIVKRHIAAKAAASAWTKKRSALALATELPPRKRSTA